MGFRNWTYKKKGFVIGLIVGIFWAVAAFAGIITCNWNIAEGSIIPNGLCKNLWITGLFYLPYEIFDLLALVLYGLVENFVGENSILYYFFSLFFLTIYAFVFASIGLIIGYFIDKSKGRKNV